MPPTVVQVPDAAPPTEVPKVRPPWRVSGANATVPASNGVHKPQEDAQNGKSEPETKPSTEPAPKSTPLAVRFRPQEGTPAPRKSFRLSSIVFRIPS